MRLSYSLFVFALLSIAILLPLAVYYISNAQGKVLTFKPRPLNDSSYLSRFYQIRYRSVDEIYDYMFHLVKSYSFFCQLAKIGHTTKKGPLVGFPIYVLKISAGFPKPVVLLIGALHANDWRSTTSILYIANQLLSNCTESRHLIATYDWHLIPILNPDGYNYSQTTPAAAKWKKNIARWSMDDQGVNLDYNFEICWHGRYNFHEETFPGLKPFSEAETMAFRNYIKRVKKYIELAIILKSPLNTTEIVPTITFPWSCKSKRPPHWVLLEYLGAVGKYAAEAATGTIYNVKQSGRLMVNQSGKMDDWLLAERIKRVLTIQTMFFEDPIMDPYDSITQTGAEVYAIVRAISLLAYNQPLSYRRLYKNIALDERVDIGTIVANMEITHNTVEPTTGGKLLQKSILTN